MRWMLFPVAAMLLAGCGDWDLDGLHGRFRQDFHYNYPLAAKGTLRLENSNGSVEISGWDKDEIDIDGTKFASTQDRLKDIKIDIAAGASSIDIRTVIPIPRYGSYGAQYVIHVPRGVHLERIATSNAQIRVDTIDGGANLSTSNAGVHVSQIRGFLDIHTSNASVDVTDATGDTIIRTSNGQVRAEVKKGSFEATSSNGSMDVRVTEADSKPVRLETSNSRIDLTLETGRAVRASTSNGGITLRLPSTADVNLRAGTSNAAITSDFDVEKHSSSRDKHHLDGVIGSGGPTVELTTSNAPIRVLKL